MSINIWKAISAICLSTIFIHPSILFSQEAKSGSSSKATKTQSRQKRIEVKLTASRAQYTAGSTSSISGIITNTSTDSTIYLTENSISLMQPQELEGPPGQPNELRAFFPTNDLSPSTSDSTAGILVLGPGESGHVGWTPDLSKRSSDTQRGDLIELIRQTTSQIIEEFNYLFFVPGDYQITVQTKYWTNPAFPPLDYQSTIQSMTVHVITPQFVILLGAALGGLAAYMIFPARNPIDSTKRSSNIRNSFFRSIHEVFVIKDKNFIRAFGAMFWSAIVTILLSRLSETQFLIRVTVSDFWGAIAIGLVAQYVGSKWLERLLGGQIANGSSALSKTKDKIPDAGH